MPGADERLGDLRAGDEEPPVPVAPAVGLAADRRGGGERGAPLREGEEEPPVGGADPVHGAVDLERVHAGEPCRSALEASREHPEGIAVRPAHLDPLAGEVDRRTRGVAAGSGAARLGRSRGDERQGGEGGEGGEAHEPDRTSSPDARAPPATRATGVRRAHNQVERTMETLAEIVSRFPVHRVLSEARLDILLHLGGALLAGGAIGIERSFHGRPAGFRTHALVCVASSLLMLLTVYQGEWFPGRRATRCASTRPAWRRGS